MTNVEKSEEDHIAEARSRLLEAMLPHVAFDGWSQTSLNEAVAETGVEPGLAKLAFPRGGVDMALAFHRAKDDELLVVLEGSGGVQSMRIRDRITHCVRRRIELVSDDREAVRRGATLFALPIHAPEGARAMWETADKIWTLCGDTSTDYNWYTKRAILSGVYSSTVLFWLGDEDPTGRATWDFLDRRIDDVMQFEKVKAAVRDNPLAKAVLAVPNAMLGMIRAPGTRWTPGG
ncbi:MAG: COQ9 family protein [Pseudomonadota bacterium]